MTDNVDRIIARTLASNHHHEPHHAPGPDPDAELDPGPTPEERVAKLDRILAAALVQLDNVERGHEIRLKRHFDLIVSLEQLTHTLQHDVARLNCLHGYALNSKE